MTMKIPKYIINALLICILALTNQLIAQNSSGMDTLRTEEIVASADTNRPFRLTLLQARQYMQSVQLVFELSNLSSDHLNHFWLNVSLRDAQGGFLYREQPALFAAIGPGKSQNIEMLCESIGIEEVGYVVLHPHLLEINRFEQAFDTTKVQLIQLDALPFRMMFAGQRK